MGVELVIPGADRAWGGELCVVVGVLGVIEKIQKSCRLRKCSGVLNGAPGVRAAADRPSCCPGPKNAGVEVRRRWKRRLKIRGVPLPEGPADRRGPGVARARRRRPPGEVARQGLTPWRRGEVPGARVPQGGEGHKG